MTRQKRNIMFDVLHDPQIDQRTHDLHKIISKVELVQFASVK